MKRYFLACAFLVAFCAFSSAQGELPSVASVSGGCLYYNRCDPKGNIALAYVNLANREMDSCRLPENHKKYFFASRVDKGRVWSLCCNPVNGDKVGVQSKTNLYSWPLEDNMQISFDVNAWPLMDMYFVQAAARARPGRFYADFLPGNPFSGKLFILADLAFPKIAVGRRGELQSRSYPTPEVEPEIRWQISVHALKEEIDPEDIDQEKVHWYKEKEFDCSFSEPFFVTEQVGKYFFYTKSGKVYYVPSQEKKPKMRAFFTAGIEWGLYGLLVNTDVNQAAAVGWDAREKKAGYFHLSEKLDVRTLELSKSPRDVNELFFLCAQKLFPARGKGDSKKDK